MSFMVQDEEEMKVFPEVFRKYYFQDIIMNHYPSYIFSNSEKGSTAKCARSYHSVVSSRFVSLVN